MSEEDIKNRILSEVRNLFSKSVEDGIQWKPLLELGNYVVIAVTIDSGDIPVDPLTWALDMNSDRCLQLKSLKGIIILLEKSAIHLEEQYIQGIAKLFEIVFPKKILIDPGDLQQPGIMIKSSEANKTAKYQKAIKPPHLTTKDSESTLTFWTIDFRTGNLEEWFVLQSTQQEIEIRNEIILEGLIEVISLR
jgi:hypothetical protein